MTESHSTSLNSEALIESTSCQDFTIAILMPVTRHTFLRVALESILNQNRLPDEIAFLVHSGDPAIDRLIKCEIDRFVRKLPQGQKAVLCTLQHSEVRLATSRACEILLDACRSRFATSLADDDGLHPNFLLVVAQELAHRKEPTVLTGRVVALGDEGRTILDSGQIVSPSAWINRILSVISGLVPGGSTVFPVAAAKKWRVFSSPVPIVTEDQLLSTRLFRHRLPWVYVPDAVYLYRQHEGQTGGGSTAEWYGVGVCRYVRLHEESRRAMRLLALVGFARELRRAGQDRVTLYRGFLDAGGSRSDARRALVIPSSLMASAQRSRARAMTVAQTCASALRRGQRRPQRGAIHPGE